MSSAAGGSACSSSSSSDKSSSHEEVKAQIDEGVSSDSQSEGIISTSDLNLQVSKGPDESRKDSDTKESNEKSGSLSLNNSEIQKIVPP